MKMKRVIYIQVILLMFFCSGCRKISDFGDTNVNPATTNTPITSALLTNVLAILGTDWGQFIMPGLYCQYFSETVTTDVSCYWQGQISPMSYYSDILYDLQNIINTNTDESTRGAAAINGANEDQIAIARILKSFNFWTITDRWGDIPYKDALKGNVNVNYDTQEVIYKDLIKELTEAITQFTNSGAPVKGDIAYNGEIIKWKKLANSLRMLMALNLSKRYPDASGYSAVQFKTALEDPAGSIESNTDNFRLDFPGGAAFRNPFYDIYDGNRFYGESETFTSLLVDSLGGDPSQSVFGADINGNPSTVGVPYGRDRAFIDPWCQQIPTWCLILAPGYRTQISPLNLINAATVLFARAEAAAMGWTTENAGTLYQEVITASFTQWGLAAPESSYFTNARVALGEPGKNLSKIAVQQYIAHYPIGIHGWNTWRRTGYPVLFPAPDATNSPKVIPRRLMYGIEDYSLTSAGVAAAVERLKPNGDKMDSRVWWDK